MSDTFITLNVLFFASLRELVQTRSLIISIKKGGSVRDLMEALLNNYPQLAKSLPYALCAVNKEYADINKPLVENDEVSFFPPVSGGKDESPDTVSITEKNLDTNEILKSITTPETGAACVFTGFVRQDTRRGNNYRTEKLEYEAYTPMAEQKMLQICQEIHEKWPLVINIYMVQRIGTLLPGEVTTAIGCSSAHRDQGIFEAARYGIDRMKEIVPVWKKEIGEDKAAWVEGKYKPAAGE